MRIFGCSCCPPNLNRLLPALGDYFYGYDEGEGAVYVNQFGDSEFALGNAKVTVKTDYPMNGTVHVKANVPVYMRVPGWCRGNFRADAPHVTSGGYARFDAGEFTIVYEMKPQLIGANVNVTPNLGKAALQRGPVVYCAEGVDNGGDVHSLFFDRTTVRNAAVEYSDFFSAPVITLPGFRIRNSSDDLYAPLDEVYEFVKIRMIPYAAFANRGETNMLVWINVR